MKGAAKKACPIPIIPAYVFTPRDHRYAEEARILNELASRGVVIWGWETPVADRDRMTLGDAAEAPSSYLSTDPLFRRGEMLSPKDLNLKEWKDVARRYFAAGLRYCSENDRHIEELHRVEVKAADDKAETTRQMNSLINVQEGNIKRLSGEVAQLKATIHLLTQPRRS